MASIKMLNAAGKYQDSLAREAVISYIFQPGKTPNHIIGGAHVDMQNPAESMTDLAASYGKDSRIRLRHFILSFLPKEVYISTLLCNVAEHICSYIGREYQIVYAVHEDTKNPHIHFVFNAVSYIDGHRYRADKADHYKLLHFIKCALYSYGLTTLIYVKYYPTPGNLNE